MNKLASHRSQKDIKYPSVFSLTDIDKEWIEDKLSSMSLYEKCAQMIMAPVYETFFDPSSPDYDSTLSLVKNHKIGGLILFDGTLKQEIEFTRRVQELSGIPLLISADYERGLGERIDNALEFPHAMALGATLNSYFAYLEGRAVAEESRLIGVNQNFAPVLDINNNYLNPVINVRSYSESKFTVSELSSSFILGTTHGKVLATAKHFPGHGNTELDSHTDLPMIKGSVSYLFNNELYPFINAIKNGVKSIMVGHLELPALDTLPSSLSRIVVTGLLQNQLNFDGLIVTDAFNMEAITKRYGMQESVILAVKAGNDIILMPPNPVETIKTIFDAVNSGEISEERINTSVRKILSAKRWLKIEKTTNLSVDNILDSVNNKYHQQLADMIAERSITLLKDDAEILPLDFSKYKNISCITITDGEGDETSQYFQNILNSRFININTQLINNKSKPSEYNNVISSIKNSDLVLLPLFIDVQSQKKNEKVRAGQINFIKKILKLNKPTVVISFKSPYIISLLHGITTLFDAYSFSYSSQNASLKAILGEIDIKGKLPVSIPDTKFKIGYGLEMGKSKETKLVTRLDDNLSIKVDSLIKEIIKTNDISNLSLCIGRDGKIIYNSTFNKSGDRLLKNSYTNKVFDLGNLTAPISLTSAVMLLINDGLFSLDDKISYYIPVLRNTDKQDITIKNLLLHNSGLSSEFDSIGINWDKSQLINSIINSKFEYKTGTKIQYSILNNVILQYLIERMCDKNLFDFLNKRLFKPLGMESTFVNRTDNNYSNNFAVTNGFRYGTSVTKKEILKSILGRFTGSDDLYSNPIDLATLAQMLIQKGYYDGSQYISASIIKDITSLQLPVSNSEWQTLKTNTAECNNFSKDSFGYYSDNGSSMWIDMSNKIFVIILTNPDKENTKILLPGLQCEIEKML